MLREKSQPAETHARLSARQITQCAGRDRRVGEIRTPMADACAVLARLMEVIEEDGDGRKEPVADGLGVPPSSPPGSRSAPSLQPRKDQIDLMLAGACKESLLASRWPLSRKASIFDALRTPATSCT